MSENQMIEICGNGLIKTHTTEGEQSYRPKEFFDLTKGNINDYTFIFHRLSRLRILMRSVGNTVLIENVSNNNNDDFFTRNLWDLFVNIQKVCINKQYPPQVIVYAPINTEICSQMPYQINDVPSDVVEFLETNFPKGQWSPSYFESPHISQILAKHFVPNMSAEQKELLTEYFACHLAADGTILNIELPFTERLFKTFEFLGNLFGTGGEYWECIHRNHTLNPDNMSLEELLILERSRLIK